MSFADQLGVARMAQLDQDFASVNEGLDVVVAKVQEKNWGSGVETYARLVNAAPEDMDEMTSKRWLAAAIVRLAEQKITEEEI